MSFQMRLSNCFGSTHRLIFGVYSVGAGWRSERTHIMYLVLAGESVHYYWLTTETPASQPRSAQANPDGQLVCDVMWWGGMGWDGM